MRILLVILHDNLEMALTMILNPNNEYCAVVTDETEPAQEILEKIGLDINAVYPIYEIKECIENFYYDFLLLVSDLRVVKILPETLRKINFPKDKFVHINLAANSDNHLLIKRAMSYYKEHSADFDMFATGMSWTAQGLDATKFKNKLFNFGRGSQDLYYDYQIAKFALSLNRTGGGRLKYALIGLTPYSFHYDESKTYTNLWKLLHYYVALEDLHNFWLEKNSYTNIFRKEFLNYQLPIDGLDTNNVYLEKSLSPIVMNYEKRIISREAVEGWANKNFPETRAENVKILDDYLTLCDNENVTPIIFLPPVSECYKKYFNRKMLDEFYYLIREAQSKHSNSVFFNAWNIQNYFSDNDFFDVDHMNSRGAAKFSILLNQVIERLEK